MVVLPVAMAVMTATHMALHDEETVSDRRLLVPMDERIIWR